MNSGTITKKVSITYFDLKKPSFLRSCSHIFSKHIEIDHLTLKVKIGTDENVQYNKETKLIHINNSFFYSCEEFLNEGIDVNASLYTLEFKLKIIEKNKQKKSILKF